MNKPNVGQMSAMKKNFVGPTVEEQTTKEMTVKKDDKGGTHVSKIVEKIPASPRPAVMSVGKRIIK